MVEVAALVGDTARATMLAALMGGQALTASELASLAHVTRPTASGHLGKLHEAMRLARVRHALQAREVEVDPELAARLGQGLVRKVDADTRRQTRGEVITPGARGGRYFTSRAQPMPAQRGGRTCVETVKCTFKLALAQEGPRTGEISDQVEL